MRVFTLVLAASLVCMVPAGALPSALPVKGSVVQQLVFTANGGSETWLAVVSRYAVTKAPVRYQYVLSLLRPNRYAAPRSPQRSGYSVFFQTPSDNADSKDKYAGFLARFTPVTYLPREQTPFKQSVRLIGTYDGYLVIEKHEALGTACGSSDVMLLGVTEEGALESPITISNRCTLSAELTGSGHHASLVLRGPHYRTYSDAAKDDADCCPAIPKASEKLIVAPNGGYTLQPDKYFIHSP